MYVKCNLCCLELGKNLFQMSCKECSEKLIRDKSIVLDYAIIGDKILDKDFPKFNDGGFEEYLKKYFPKDYEIDCNWIPKTNYLYNDGTIYNR